MIRFAFILLTLPFVLSLANNFEPSLPQSEESKIDTTIFVERHNYYRRQVGSPDIHWNDSLADYAKKWADYLSKTCELDHSGGEYGENIFWSSRTADETEVVDLWAAEKKYFNHNNPRYVSGRSYKSGHYSQIIWANSTELGAGFANCKNGGQIWVCVYNPAGNVVGEMAY